MGIPVYDIGEKNKGKRVSHIWGKFYRPSRMSKQNIDDI